MIGGAIGRGVRAARAVLVLCALAAAGAGASAGCDKPDWVDALDKRLQKAVPELEAALARLADDIPRLEGKANQAIKDNIALLNRLLRENIDGLNQILTENRQRLDAALVARVEQLARFAQQLDANVTALVARTVDHVTVSVDELIAQTDLASRALLSSLDLQIARVRDENGQTVASVYSAPPILSALLTCEAVAAARPQYDVAVDRVADMRRVLGISRPCAGDGECPTGKWCDVVSSSCTDQCRHDNECPAGQLCHADGRFCRAPCGPSSACPVGFACNTTGRCARSRLIFPGVLHIGGGTGWDVTAKCGKDTVCLRANPALRNLLPGGK